jgi:hypothetical protein
MQINIAQRISLPAAARKNLTQGTLSSTDFDCDVRHVRTPRSELRVDPSQEGTTPLVERDPI